MESLYLLIPLSVVLVFGIMAVFGWALFSGQFDEIDREGARILEDEMPKPFGPGRQPLDPRQAGSDPVPADSAASRPVPSGRGQGPRSTPHP